ncbi:MAG: hypothetical protein AAGC70_08735 [Pseudomonadota bacterium]
MQTKALAGIKSGFAVLWRDTTALVVVFLLAWVIGTLAVVALNCFTFHFTQRLPERWAVTLVWAVAVWPVVDFRVLRHMFQQQAPDRFSLGDFWRVLPALMVIACLAAAATLVIDGAAAGVRGAVLALAVDSAGRADPEIYQAWWFPVLYTGVSLIADSLQGFVAVIAFIATLNLVLYGALFGGDGWVFLRRNLLILAALAAVLAIVLNRIDFSYELFLSQMGVHDLTPWPIVSWRELVLPQALSSAAYFPTLFVSTVVPIVMYVSLYLAWRGDGHPDEAS